MSLSVMNSNTCYSVYYVACIIFVDNTMHNLFVNLIIISDYNTHPGI